MTRFQNQLDTAFRLAAGLNDAELAPALDQIRQSLQDQDRIMEQLQDKTGTPDDAILLRTRDQIRLHLNWTDEAQINPLTLRNRFGPGGNEFTPPTDPLAPVDGYGPGPFITGSPTPGSSYGPGPGLQATCTCTPQSGQGPQPETGNSYGPGPQPTEQPGNSYGPGPQPTTEPGGGAGPGPQPTTQPEDGSGPGSQPVDPGNGGSGSGSGN